MFLACSNGRDVVFPGFCCEIIFCYLAACSYTAHFVILQSDLVSPRGSDLQSCFCLLHTLHDGITTKNIIEINNKNSVKPWLIDPGLYKTEGVRF